MLYFQSDVAHALGLCHRVHLLNKMVNWVEVIEAQSCSAVHVSDSMLGGVPTRVFQPKKGKKLKRGVIYFHGGGWALASGRECRCLNFESCRKDLLHCGIYCRNNVKLLQLCFSWNYYSTVFNQNRSWLLNTVKKIFLQCRFMMENFWGLYLSNMSNKNEK